MAGLSRARIHHPMLTPAVPGWGLLSKEEMRYVQAAEGLNWLSWRPFVYRKILDWSLEQEPALLHGISEHAAHVTASLAESLKLPYLLTVHQYLEGNSLRITQRCRAVIAVSEPLREHLVNDVRIPRERVRVVAPGVSDVPTSSFPGILSGAIVSADEPNASMDTGVPIADIPKDARLVVSVGDFNKTSDYATFMEATRHIIDRQGDTCSIVVCGEGPQEASLRKFCRELHLDRRVTFCHGHTEIERLMSEADVYVQTTRREGFAVRALQAMAQGVPVVAAANGAVLELIEDGLTGYIVPPANHERLGERILALLSDDALRDKIGSAACASAKQHYSVETMMDATLDIYHEVASSPVKKN
jgi:glycosyltransferase involved in cell wall biosynthesis